MGCFPFANYHFQMGVTAMGFAEDFGLSLFGCNSEDSKETEHGIRNEGVRTAQGVKASNKDQLPTQTVSHL